MRRSFRRHSGVGHTAEARHENRLRKVEEFLERVFPDAPNEIQEDETLLPRGAIDQIVRELSQRGDLLAFLMNDGQVPEEYFLLDESGGHAHDGGSGGTQIAYTDVTGTPTVPSGAALVAGYMTAALATTDQLMGNPWAENRTDMSLPEATSGTARGIKLVMEAAPGAGSNVIATLYINNVATALTVTVSGASDVRGAATGSVAWVADDRLEINIKYSGNVPASTIYHAVVTA